MEVQIKCTGSDSLNIDKLTEFQGELKSLTTDNYNKLKKVILKLGFSSPIHIWKQNGNNNILDGHQRLRVLKKMRQEGYYIPKLPVVYVDAESEHEAKMKVLALTSQYGTLENDGLYEFISENEITIDDVEANFEFPQVDIKAFNAEFFKEPDGSEDEVEELNKEPYTRTGDLWILGNHRLLCGDATKKEDVEKLMDGQKADMVFTDPPYGLNYSGGRTQVVAKKEYGKIKNDNLKDIELGKLLVNILLAKGDIYVCVSPIIQKPFLDFIENNGREINAVIVWDKKNIGLGYMAYRRQCEFIYYIRTREFKKGDVSDSDLWSIPKELATNYKHGTQKPVAVPERAIKNSSITSNIVMDLFLGSGSTLIACEKTKRRCYGMEIDPLYCDVIVNRYIKYTERKDVKLIRDNKEYNFIDIESDFYEEKSIK